jgi:hypothetical protein
LVRASLRYVRIRVPEVHAGEDWRAELWDLPLLPVHITGEAGATVYAIATSAAARLDDLGFWVDRLGGEDEPLTTALLHLAKPSRVRPLILGWSDRQGQLVEGGCHPQRSLLVLYRRT